jgi:hypothetical protein
MTQRHKRRRARPGHVMSSVWNETPNSQQADERYSPILPRFARLAVIESHQPDSGAAHMLPDDESLSFRLGAVYRDGTRTDLAVVARYDRSIRMWCWQALCDGAEEPPTVLLGDCEDPETITQEITDRLRRLDPI